MLPPLKTSNPYLNIDLSANTFVETSSPALRKKPSKMMYPKWTAMLNSYNILLYSFSGTILNVLIQSVNSKTHNIWGRLSWKKRNLKVDPNHQNGLDLVEMDDDHNRNKNITHISVLNCISWISFYP